MLLGVLISVLSLIRYLRLIRDLKNGTPSFGDAPALARRGNFVESARASNELLSRGHTACLRARPLNA